MLDHISCLSYDLPEGGEVLVGTAQGLLILVGGLRPLGFPVLMFPSSVHVKALGLARERGKFTLCLN